MPRKPKKRIKEQTLRMLVNIGCYGDGKNDYAGLVGKIYLCNKCCGGKLRIKFYGMANDEFLENFDLSKCKFFIDNDFTYLVGREKH